MLVTGATGFVGLHTARALINAGHTVRFGVRSEPKIAALLQTLELPPQEVAVGEVTDRAAIDRALEGCDALVHAAALVSMDPGQAELMHRTNVEGTKTVINAALQKGLQSIVYISSAAALYDPTLSSIDENTALAKPVSAYASSKAEAERHVREHIAQGANIAITYPASVIGPDDPGTSEGNRSLEIILKYSHINTSTGLQIIDVRDLAMAHVRLLEKNVSGRFLVAGHYLPWPELGRQLEVITARRLLKLPIPGTVLRTFGSLVDVLSSVYPITLPLNREAMDFATRWVICNDSKLRNELGVQYRPIAATIADTVVWLAAEGHIAKKWAASINA